MRLNKVKAFHNLPTLNLHIHLYIWSWKLAFLCILTYHKYYNMNKTVNSTTSKYNSTGSNSPASREMSTMAMESLISPLIATEQLISPAKTTCYERKENMEDCKVLTTIETIMKQAAKTRAGKSLPHAVDQLVRNQVTVPMGSTVIDCGNGEFVWTHQY